MDSLHSGISLRQLRYLVAVADAGSFSAAAELTHVAQPALSRQIALLELQVDMRLLVRAHAGVTLTDGGRRLYTLARELLVRIGNMQTELVSHALQPSGVVHVAMPTSLASLLVPGVVRELELSFPAIGLQIDDGLCMELGRGLDSSQVDFGIVAGADQLMEIEHEPLLNEILMFVERQDETQHLPATIRFDDVARRKLALPPRSFHTRRVVDEAARACHLTLFIVHEQQSLAAIMGLVREGMAATITSSPAVQQFWPAGRVNARRIIEPEITRTMSLARPCNRVMGVAAEAVFNIVKRLAGEAAADGRWLGNSAD